VPVLDKRADQVTATDAANARVVLRTRYAPGSVKLTLYVLSTLYGWGVSQVEILRSQNRQQRYRMSWLLSEKSDRSTGFNLLPICGMIE